MKRPILFFSRTFALYLFALPACSSSQEVPGGAGGSGSCGNGELCSSGGASNSGGTIGVASGGAEGGSGGVFASGGADGSGATLNQSGGADGNSGGETGMSGGAASGGAGQTEPAFILGADISGVQESDSTFVDTDGQQKSIFALLKNHGFNYIRLRTFVEPGAPYGYSSSANGCDGMSETFGDKAHVIAYGKQAKDAGMGFLLNFHYSDVWADPGNQIIPDAWRSATDTNALAALMKAYTKDVIQGAIAAGARPDMVQVGNEITPGMMAHLPGPDTDCWGNNPGSTSPIGGSTSNWTQLATLLKAGIAGVREVDPSIKVMLHIENTDDLDGVKWWVQNATSNGVEFDVLGLSCYTEFQGQPSVWQNTFSQMANDYPNLEFVIAEYNPERTQANTIMKNMPNGRGLGTFFWEPTRSGEWGDAMFTWEGNTATAIPSDFAEYDAMLPSLGL